MHSIKNLNLANKLTLTRMILLIPLLLVTALYVVLSRFSLQVSPTLIAPRILIVFVLLIFGGAMITDFLDGYFARKNKTITPFGKLWDPIADKMITTVTLIFIAVISSGYVSYLLVALLIVRDLIVDGCRVVMKEHKIDVAASIWGKIKTIILSSAIVFILILNIVWPSLDLFVINYVSGISLDAITWGLWWVVNIPLMLALGFSVFSGVLYVVKAWKLVIAETKVQESDVDLSNEDKALKPAPTQFGSKNDPDFKEDINIKSLDMQENNSDMKPKNINIEDTSEYSDNSVGRFNLD
ncbi:CDP-diacylglycerol-glycerol-3-phosphate3-phosphatidyltransferase [Mycoplasmopsis californica HAZ160_1]|uniref:CDP-diacylglycerol--glycerol-3-phosphate 3-phosphatidyltransferase n=2 Tax=Mycoplasmopsis californica TaxID=2113 RepID=A0A059XRY1_9BACT|nr:CDP-diacylglycerol--glycerol-3-phosphate 3-phosphatidyltransferase [Mycoplasmopsis californica]AIA29578.1 CDP-diacylglycerol--glycerol-3-phosphate 3-phosphatidyltransferase [Mycoplasmopsis californica]BAP00980.1 CDP-diacylglycerol-glycerol-3-phosphate3-phosphatidyltransferase [Mycoplasmopsis californica HAZ160_1]BBG40844.1 CDP-diacylglycerol-glycerol-3-phosphate3-phosphatidyltransferase [Mycoplasmopsis californica]BBG41438.1 CDP-diacylglycerol-glycerol-3-phosphate3-phosphatidyltransferase [M